MTRATPAKARPGTPTKGPVTVRLLADIRRLIEETRSQIAQAVNAGLVALYWSIGERIRRDILKGRRAGCGEEIVSAPGRELRRTHLRRLLERKVREAIRLSREQLATRRAALP